MQLGIRHLPDLFAMLLSLMAQWKLAVWLLASGPLRSRRLLRAAIAAASALVSLWIAFGFFFSVPRFYHWLPDLPWIDWIRGAGILYSIAIVGAFMALLLVRGLGRHSLAFDPSRRRLLRTSGVAAVAVPALTVGYGSFLVRRNIILKEVDIQVPGLPRDLHGLRLAQLTDIHLSPFFSPADLRYSVALANDTRPHLALVTGDLITASRDPLDDCLEILRGLRADSGIWGCLGNHEIYASCEDYTASRGDALGIRFLRREAVTLPFGNARLNLAGVDYQRMGGPYLEGAARFVKPGALNVLLSHNPDVFPVAARLGFDVTLAGHTHGGQVTVEILHQHLNVARIFTPFVWGKYQVENARLYVSPGLGTVGAPVRLGAPPEVSLIRLCAT